MNFEGLFTKKQIEKFLKLKRRPSLTVVDDPIEVQMIRQKLQIYGPYEILLYKKDKKGKFVEVWGAFNTAWEDRLAYRVI